MTVNPIQERVAQGFGGIAKTLFMVAFLAALAACQFGTPQPDSDPAERARVTVQGTGLHKITARALAEMGWSAETPLNLTLNDSPVPFQARGGELLFYLPSDTPSRYSQTHTLWLVPGESQGAVATGRGEAAISTLTGITRLGAEEQYSSV